MREGTRFAAVVILISTLAYITGCSSGGGDNQPTPPTNHAPTVTLASNLPDSIYGNQSITFTWQGSDLDGDLAYFLAGLDGNLDTTQATDTTFSNLTTLTTYQFSVLAVDSTSLQSSTATWSFYVNYPQPLVAVLSTPPPNIHNTVDPVFTWQGTAPQSTISGYFVGLNGAFVWTTQTTTSYAGLTTDNTYLFQVVAQNQEGILSDTSDYTFNVVSEEVLLTAWGVGVVDADQDGFYTQFDVAWVPEVTTQTPSSQALRLYVSREPTFSIGTETYDSSAVVTRNFGDLDTLYVTLSPAAKQYYDIRVDLQDGDGETLMAVPYETIPSLTQVGLEDVDGFFASFDSAWTDNKIDSLPVGNPDNYYESIEILGFVHAYPDAGEVKIILYERDSGGAERYMSEIRLNLSQSSTSYLFGFLVEAGLTFGNYDYRLDLRDLNNNLLAQIPYEQYNSLTDIPLGNPGPIHLQNVAYSVQL